MFDVWKNVLAEVEQSIPHEQFITWFPGVTLVSVEEDVATIGVPNVFKIKKMKGEYAEVIRRAFEHNNIEIKEFKYVVRDEGARPKIRSGEITRSQPVQPARVMRAGALKPSGNHAFQTGLNPRYRLDNFVIGANNDLAVSVAQNIIKFPGEKYNPFFLYSGPGLGKTHLVQAIGNEILANNPKLKVFYTPASSFLADFVKHIKVGKGEEFRQKFMKLDVLIIDDFQMMVGKDRSQEEFFAIFNELHQANKQIIVTSDRLPSQIKTVDERLASRLIWAGAFDLQLPQFEEKCAILKSKAEFKGVFIEDRAIEYLAENVRTNIRELEGEFERLLAVAELKNMTPLEVIGEGYVNTSSGNPQAKSVSPKLVVEKVAKYYQLTVKEMCGKSRVAHIKNARQVAMYILSKELEMSTTKIAFEVGVKDHTTVMHGVRKITNDLKLNFNLRDQIAAIKEKIYG